MAQMTRTGVSEKVDNTTLATLAAGAAGRISVTANVGHTYRAHASVAAGTTTLDIWITGG